MLKGHVYLAGWASLLVWRWANVLQQSWWCFFYPSCPLSVLFLHISLCKQLIVYVESARNMHEHEHVGVKCLEKMLWILFYVHFCFISRHMITGAASHSLKYIMRHYSSGAPEHNMSVNVCFVNASVLFKWQIHKMISLNELKLQKPTSHWQRWLMDLSLNGACDVCVSCGVTALFVSYDASSGARRSVSKRHKYGGGLS